MTGLEDQLGRLEGVLIASLHQSDEVELAIFRGAGDSLEGERTGPGVGFWGSHGWSFGARGEQEQAEQKRSRREVSTGRAHERRRRGHRAVPR